MYIISSHAPAFYRAHLMTCLKHLTHTPDNLILRWEFPISRLFVIHQHCSWCCCTYRKHMRDSEQKHGLLLCYSVENKTSLALQRSRNSNELTEQQMFYYKIHQIRPTETRVRVPFPHRNVNWCLINFLQNSTDMIRVRETKIILELTMMRWLNHVCSKGV